MRKLLIPILLCSSCIVEAQVRVKIQGGMNFSNIIFKYDDGRKGSNTFIPRFNGGLIFEIPLEDNWFLYTGPNYSGKGYVLRAKRSSYTLDTIKVRLNYAEIPLTIGYKFSDDKFTLNSGLYFAYGFNGERSYNGNLPTPEKHLHRKNEEYKRCDFGYNIGAMYQPLERFGIKLEYSKSLVNISRYIDNKKRNIVFGFSFFWYLNKRKSAGE